MNINTYIKTQKKRLAAKKKRCEKLARIADRAETVVAKAEIAFGHATDRAVAKVMMAKNVDRSDAEELLGV